MKTSAISPTSPACVTCVVPNGIISHCSSLGIQHNLCREDQAHARNPANRISIRVEKDFDSPRLPLLSMCGASKVPCHYMSGLSQHHPQAPVAVYSGVLCLLLEHDLWQIPQHYPDRTSTVTPSEEEKETPPKKEACLSRCQGSDMESPFRYLPTKDWQVTERLVSSEVQRLSTRGQLCCGSLEDVCYARHEVLTSLEHLERGETCKCAKPTPVQELLLAGGAGTDHRKVHPASSLEHWSTGNCNICFMSPQSCYKHSTTP